jgi:rhamnosyltransferase
MIACILVLYNPDFEAFRTVLESIASQADTVFIVDNSNADNQSRIAATGKVRYIGLRRNLGIAAAQNIGIRAASELKPRYIWLSDQDTVYPQAYVHNMLAAFAQSSGRIASLAPAYFDTHKGAVQHFIDHTPFTHYFAPKPGVQGVSHAIASGIFIPADVLEVVGLMQEDLFIDWVDLEWCWRAKYRFGYRNLGTGDVVIQHTMGDQYVDFLNRKVSFRSPVRHYYMIRNAVHLALHSRSVGPAIRLEILAKALAWTFIFPGIAPDRKRQHLRATVAGFLDGLRNRMGPRPQ